MSVFLAVESVAVVVVCIQSWHQIYLTDIFFKCANKNRILGQNSCCKKRYFENFRNSTLFLIVIYLSAIVLFTGLWTPAGGLIS